MLSPIAHVVFKICRTNICPRMGNRSILTCQDLIVVSWLLVGKKFDVVGLILKHMIGCVKKKKTTLPFDLLLTKIFKYSRVKLDNRDKVAENEFVDIVSLTRSRLRISSDGVLEKIPPPVQVQAPLSLSIQPDSSTISDLGLFNALVDIMISFVDLKMSLKSLQAKVKELKSLILAKPGVPTTV